MENDEVDSSLSPNKKLDLAQWLEKLCEYYMAMGVSFEEFWFGDYCRLKFYEQAYFNKLKRRDYDLWLEGRYVLEAVGVALAKSFGGRSDIEYPKQPFGYEKPEDNMSQEELFAYIQEQLEAEAKAYERNHRSK